MTQTKTEVRAEVLGCITKVPELSRTTEGVAVCRFMVATQVGPASNPVVKAIFVVGDLGARPSEDLPVRCMNLGVGDKVYVPGVERQRIRCRRGVRYPESAIEARDVRLRERAQRKDRGA
jgi:hypothetical protein